MAGRFICPYDEQQCEHPHCLAKSSPYFDSECSIRKDAMDATQPRPETGQDVTNPKDKVGSRKVSISKLPAVAILQGALAMMDGSSRYESYNFREAPVRASIYVDAALRHLLDWFEGMEKDDKSNVHHLGHAIACCAILLDAQAHGKLVDDRPLFGGDPELFHKILTELNEVAGTKQDKRVTK